MARISSLVNDFERIDRPGKDNKYVHPSAKRTGYMPMAFQVTSPVDYRKVLLPHALVLHINPNNFAETHTKKVEKIQTRGGFVEQHWGDELSEISASGSTGSFLNIYTGTTSLVRQRSIAWDRFRDLVDLYHNNGSVYDPYGNVVLQGQIMLMYDKGVYYGTFRNFDYEETGDSPFAFTVNWSFKVEMTVIQFPGALTGRPLWGPKAQSPGFQASNVFENQEAKLAAEAKATYDKTSAALLAERKQAVQSSVNALVSGTGTIASDLTPEEIRVVQANATAELERQDEVTRQADPNYVAEVNSKAQADRASAQFAQWQRTGQKPVVPTQGSGGSVQSGSGGPAPTDNSPEAVFQRENPDLFKK
jgi:hypothetical protein